MNTHFQIGVIASTHGLKGEVNVFPTTDDINRFKVIKNVLLDTGKEHIPLEITGVKYVKKFVVLKFKEFQHINEVEKYKGKSLLVTRENAVPLNEGEHYIADLVGLQVYSDEDRELGRLSEVLQTGANDVYVVKTPEGSEILIPAIKQCILEVEIEKKYMKVHLLDGLV